MEEKVMDISTGTRRDFLKTVSIGAASLMMPAVIRCSGKSRKLPNIVDLREDVNRFSEQKELSNPRGKIKKLLKKHPNFSDLRALNGIQIFNDTAQSGLSEKRLSVVEMALKEV